MTLLDKSVQDGGRQIRVETEVQLMQLQEFLLDQEMYLRWNSHSDCRRQAAKKVKMKSWMQRFGGGKRMKGK